MVTVQENADLTVLNTFGMKVKCRKLIEYSDAGDLPTVFREVGSSPYFHIGEGSNLLFSGDYDGCILRSRILTIEADMIGDGKARIAVGSGIRLDSLVENACLSGMWGLENLTDIPGQVGAAAVQNVGAYGVEIKDSIESVVCYNTLTHELVTFSKDECRYGYRDSVFKHEPCKGRYIVVEVNFILTKQHSPNLEYGNLAQRLGYDHEKQELTPMMVREAVRAVRREKLPAIDEFGSAGSFFKNPVIDRRAFDEIERKAHIEHGAHYRVPHFELPEGVKIPAAWLIEDCGWKGKTLGNAAVWHKQPLILINNTGKATPDEIIALRDRIMSDVEDKFGIRLHPEVETVG